MECVAQGPRTYKQGEQPVACSCLLCHVVTKGNMGVTSWPPPHTGMGTLLSACAVQGGEGWSHRNRFESLLIFHWRPPVGPANSSSVFSE